MKYAYYPGCSLHSTAREYDHTLRAVCRRMDIELIEIKEWFCCGSTPAHSVSRLLAAALPLGNLAILQKMGFHEVLVPCPSCFSRFRSALHHVKNESELRKDLEWVIDGHWGNSTKDCHPLQLFSDESQLNKIASLCRTRLGRLKAVCYYGCLLTRPPKIADFDCCEYPESMDRLLAALGAATLDWSYKTECCGASFSLTRTDIVLKLCREILDDAKTVGADVIAVACPLCQFNLDARQQEIERIYGSKYDLPILYFTQLMGIGFGLSARDLMIGKHFVRAERMLEEAMRHAG